MIRRVMAEAGRTFADLGAVAVTVGPGAFPGVRIGLAAARRIALPASLPFLADTTLEALALAAAAGTPPPVATGTHHDELHTDLFASRSSQQVHALEHAGALEA